MSKFLTAQGVNGQVAFNVNQLSSIHWSNHEQRIELILTNGKEIDLRGLYKEVDVNHVVAAIHHAENDNVVDDFDLDELISLIKDGATAP